MALVAGCTSAEPRPDPTTAGADILSPSDVGVLLIADGSSPVSGAHHRLTVYDDGWAVVAESGGLFFGEDDYVAKDRTLRIEGDALARVRTLVGDPGFLGAESDYHQQDVFDGGVTIYAAGTPARRIIVSNRPTDMPGALTQLEVQARAISEAIDAKGTDPFDDPELPARARILLRYDWWGAATGRADRLTVYDDGLLEYRRTASSLAPERDGDYPTPVAITWRVDPAALAGLRGLVSSRTVRVLPFMDRDDDRIADSHHFRVRGKTLLRDSHRLEPPLTSIVAEIDPLLDEMRTRA